MASRLLAGSYDLIHTTIPFLDDFSLSQALLQLTCSTYFFLLTISMDKFLGVRLLSQRVLIQIFIAIDVLVK